MNKWTKALLAVVLTAVLLMPGAALAEEMGMMDTEMKDMKMVDTSMYYKGVEMMTKGGKEYVQLRQLSEKLGYTIGWNNKTRTVTLTGMKKAVMMEDKDMMMEDKGMMTEDKDMMMEKCVFELIIGSMAFKHNSMMMKTMDKPMIIKGRTFVTKEFANMYLIKMSM